MSSSSNIIQYVTVNSFVEILMFMFCVSGNADSATFEVIVCGNVTLNYIMCNFYLLLYIFLSDGC